ncbi:MAG: transcription-repair coupling factor [Spirochaetes bacterium]|nr:transcription-repair coupling factor [Spirochaetota bacterium]
MENKLQEIVESFERSFGGDFGALFTDSRTDSPVHVTGLSGSSRALFILSLYRKTKRAIVVVTRNNREGERFINDITLLFPDTPCYMMPSKETLPYDRSEPLTELTAKRITALNALLGGERSIYIVPVRSFIDLFMPKDLFLSSLLRLKRGDTVPLVEVDGRLAALGYEKEEQAVVPGNFARRGDILDIFVYGEEHPCRVEFLGDEIESIRMFSKTTQRSIEPLEEICILPAREVVLDRNSIDRGLREGAGGERELMELIDTEGFFPGIEMYTSVLYRNPSTVVDYAGSETMYLFVSIESCREQAAFFKNETARLYEEFGENGVKEFIPNPRDMMADFEGLVARTGPYHSISLLPAEGTKTLDFGIEEKKGYRGQIREFKDDLVTLLEDGWTVVVGAGYEGQTNRLRELLRDLCDRYENLLIMTLDLSEGFYSPKMKLFVVLDREIFNRKRRYKRKFLESKSAPIEGIFAIAEGDYIVHIEHGIGVYRGIERLTSRGVVKDFVKIEYRDGDEIFVPVDQINILQKYIGQEGRVPRIDRLGSGLWKRVKDHVKRSVKELASQLLELYSARESLQGHAFGGDTEWQYEFESGFRYEETPDQLRSIEEIKRDMEAKRPMDRLVCGDVGYGKTEVAIRSAFKAVMDGKQVAVLVPTTVLAEQHLNTFIDRFSFYPIRVEMLSRFRTRSQQRKIIELLEKGEIDVVIGTHRLIQDDVRFKDLGLVIIDEEQRFGVEHKEKLKQLRKLVDVLTMTATPIPRTLYMAMNRIRDMSVIETPPRERMPIETFVMEYNENVVSSAIRREIERDGQVYFVHNRVRTIEERAERLRMRMPDVTFEVAHGQMDEHELESIMQAFYDQEFEVLVTTTIIESGLDIPNVNTIILERADRFGLSQLYQLRGRVGRGKRKAYAYLFYPPGIQITEQAQKRLVVINDHTELGAGFQIAMKDLEIRGAGNVLGKEQHGEMLAVGYEMYIKLLDQAIDELRLGEAYREEIEPVLDLDYKGYIPKRYMGSEKLRVEIYKRLAGLKSSDDLAALEEEVKDRFGPPPGELVALFEVVRLRVLCKTVGIRSVRERENELEITFEQSRIDIISLLRKINENPKIFSISPRNRDTLHIYKRFQDNGEKLEFLRELFGYEDGS